MMMKMKMIRAIMRLVLVPSLVILLGVTCPLCEGDDGCPEEEGYKKPRNCEILECPAYDVVHSQPEFEIREYKDANWIYFPVPDGRSYFDAANKGFILLYAYTQGKNKGRIQMNMTAPVLVDNPRYPTARKYATEANDDDNNNNNSASSSSYAVYFYLPEKYQKNPPTPIADYSEPVHLPPYKYKYAAVKRFGGYMNNNNVDEQAIALKDNLKGTSWNAALSATSFAAAGYDGPDDLKDRVNEIIIWFHK